MKISTVLWLAANKYLSECNTSSLWCFNSFTRGHARQCARYNWLMFASLYAEELENAEEMEEFLNE